MNHAEARVDRQQAIDAEVPLSDTTSGGVPEIAVMRRAQRARKIVGNASGKQRPDAAEARDDAPRLRVCACQFFWRATRNGCRFGPSVMCELSPDTPA